MRWRSCRSSGDSEHHVELGLPDQDDLDQLGGVGLEVREQPDLLERLAVEVLRLVDRSAARGALRWRFVEQEVIELVQQLAARLALRLEPELGVDGLEQLERRELRVEQERDLAARLEPLEQRAAQRGLARADFTGDRR